MQSIRVQQIEKNELKKVALKDATYDNLEQYKIIRKNQQYNLK